MLALPAAKGLHGSTHFARLFSRSKSLSMLRRYRQIRMQIHQLMDACLFAVAFYLAYVLRSSLNVTDFLGMAPEISSFESYVWLYLFLIPAAPLVLEAQGFYNRPMLYSRATTLWQLFKGCLFMTLGLVLV